MSGSKRLSEGQAMQNPERDLFELHIRSVDPMRANDRLRRHTSETWWGTDESMPMYRDPWTEGLWIGWKLRAGKGEDIVADALRYRWLRRESVRLSFSAELVAQLVANQAELDGAIRQDMDRKVES
jgi:hypothetical protein